MKRMLWLVVVAVCAAGVVGILRSPQNVHAAPVGFMSIQGDKFMLNGSEYFVKGMNFHFPFKYNQAKFLDLGSIVPNTEWYEPQMQWRTFDAQKIAEEFQYYHTVLGVNTIRLFTPSLNYLDSQVQYYGWDPWFLYNNPTYPDGSINPIYRDRIIQIIDIAKQNGILVSLELFHNSHFLDWECRGSAGTWSSCSLDQVRATAASGVDARFVDPGTTRETRYLNYLQSLIPYLKDNSGIFSYEIANESLLDWNFNGQGIAVRRDWFQDKVGSYLLRMTREIRRLDPNHLITEGEVTEHGVSQPGWWAWPSPEFAPLNDIHNLNGGQPYTLASFLDFLSPHFYLQNPAYPGPAAAAIRSRTTKPVVLGEFGYFLTGGDPLAAPVANQTRLSYIQNVVALPRSQVFGYFLWAPLPPLDLVPGYSVVSMPSSPWGAVRGIQLPGSPSRTIIAPADPRNSTFDYQFTLFTYDTAYPFNMKPLPEATAYFGSIQPASNNSTCVSNTIPTSMTPGETRNVTVQFQNTGTKPWIAAGGKYVLSIVPWPPASPSVTPNVFAIPRDVQPGETLSHTFALTAPTTPGTYVGNYQLAESGVAWFGATCGPQTITVAATAPQTNGATFISQSVPSSLTPGQSAQVSITFKNTGTKAWDKIGSAGDYANAYRIKSQNPADNTTWGTSFIPIPSAPIQPNQTATFTFNITAPTTPGTYNFQWQMNQGGVGWFGDLSPNRAITVAATAPATIALNASGGALPCPGGSATPVALSWTSVSGASGYRVKRSSASGGPYTVVAQNLTATSYADASIGSENYYIVTAVNATGSEVGSSREVGVSISQPVCSTLPPSPSLTFTIDGGSASTRQQLQTFSFAGSGFTPGGTVQRWSSFNNGVSSTLSPDFPASTQGLVSWMFTPSCTTPPGTYALWLKDLATGRTSGQVAETVVRNPACSTSAPPPPPSQYNLREGDVISASDPSDPDLYIVNAHGYKRLFLNPVIFGFYGHLGGWNAVKSVSASVRDVFPTSGLFRNCETNDEKVYAVEVTGEDTGTLHHINMTGSQAVAEDPDFFKKVFCINSNEFNWYTKSPVPYTALSQVPTYRR